VKRPVRRFTRVGDWFATPTENAPLRPSLATTPTRRRPRASLVIIAAILSACAPLPTVPPEVRTTTVQVPVPVPVPCFTDAERPVLAPEIVADPETATTEQLAAAELGNAEALRDYTNKVDALFIQCSSKGTTP